MIITRATQEDAQRQQRAAWRQLDDAVTRHTTRNVAQLEEIRKAQAGLRAAMKAGNRAGVHAWHRHLRQLLGNEYG